MGRQIQFNALPEDLQEFLKFVEQRDPVIVMPRDSDSPGMTALENPSLEVDVMTLWNRGLLSSLQRKHIVIPGRDYYSFDDSLPILELSLSRRYLWNGREGLLSGRIYGTFDAPIPGYGKWYDALARWIRTHFVKSPLPLISYAGPSAYDWYKKGGLLLPMMVPPSITPSWLSWIEAQDQHRAIFSR
jgi:hypothetical protein